ncbi:MAG: hypothetical protein HFJ27_01720 [Clostridia bacterium]|nr:hypothetical protein [Clostridia bacterium]
MFKRKQTNKIELDDDSLIYHYRQITREQRQTIDSKNEQLKRIVQLTEANRYDNTEAILHKINELAKTAIQD